MINGNENAKIQENALLKDAIVELSRKGLGIVNVVNSDDELMGVITDGDLRRLLAVSYTHLGQLILRD